MFQTTNQKSYDYEFTTIFSQVFSHYKTRPNFQHISAQAAVQDGTMMFHRLALPILDYDMFMHDDILWAILS